MKKINPILILILSLSCKANNPGNTSKNIDKNNIINTWLRSYKEEKENKIMVFRTKEYDFPPSRGRQKWIIKADSTFISINLGPSDKPVKINGKWHIRKNYLVFDIKNNRKAFNLIECSDTLLKVKPVKPK